jgi:hypothetical protein
MRRLLLLAPLAAVAAGCGGGRTYVSVPSNHGRPLDVALRRLHADGLRASFPAWRTPCGMGLPFVNVQSPRAPARVRRGSTVTLSFVSSPLPSAAVPKDHPRWTHVPRLVGDDFGRVTARLVGIWPCPHGAGATATTASDLVVAAQRPSAGARVPDYGFMTGRAFHPTTVDLTVAAAG